MGLIHPLSLKPKGRIPANAYVASRNVVCHDESEFAEWAGAPLPFPMYVICCDEFGMWKSTDYTPGRILVNCSDSGPDESVHFGSYLREDLDQFACTQDVILTPMFEGSQNAEGPFPLAPNRGYEHNLAVLKELAPQVRAIACGNRGAEMGFCQKIPDGDPIHKANATQMLCESIDVAANMVGECGGRLALMLIDYHALIDAYWANGAPVREKLLEHNVLTIFLLGFKFWPRCKPLFDHDPKQRILPKELLDQPPYPILQDWLSGIEAWSGVDYLQGLQRGNHWRCFQGGFSAGVIGQLPDGSQ